jgi:hypothetical protein
LGLIGLPELGENLKDMVDPVDGWVAKFDHSTDLMGFPGCANWLHKKLFSYLH